VWNRAGPLSAADWERVRLSPYWTSRAAKQVGHLEVEAEMASHACERLDGSGYFRDSRHASTPLESRVPPVATIWLALKAHRPWREALADDVAKGAAAQPVPMNGTFYADQPQARISVYQSL
jgi:response regulator RpfG family c-di-GMP phosphodiesterase